MEKKKFNHGYVGRSPQGNLLDKYTHIDEKWIIKKEGELPLCAVPDEIQPAIIGIPISIYIVASAPDGQITGIEAMGLPLWTTLHISNKLPASDVIACVFGTPGLADEGLYAIPIVATDNDGNQAISHIKISVTDYGFMGEQPGVF